MTATETEDTTAWLNWRKKGIGATDVAKAHTRKYGGAYSVVADKLGLLIDKPATGAMLRGQRWEPILARTVEAITGLTVAGEQTQCMHQGNPIHRATVDGFLMPTPTAPVEDVIGLCEIKTVGSRTEPAWDYYTAQTQWQMYVTDLDRATIALGTIDDDRDALTNFTMRQLQRDDALIAQLVDLADWLWGDITNGLLPLEPGAEALDTVKEVWREISLTEPNTCNITRAADKVKQLSRAKDRIKEAEKTAKAIEAELRDMIADRHAGITDDGWRVSVSKPAQRLDDRLAQQFLEANPAWGKWVLDTKRLQAEEPELYNGLRTATGARTLRITKPKPKTKETKK